MREPASWVVRWFGGQETSTGVVVTAETAMQATAVLAAVRLLSESIASLPLKLYRRRNGKGRDEATDHPLYKLIHGAPSRRHTSMEFREMLQAHLSLRGNAYAFIDWSTSGQVKQLIPLNPDRIVVKVSNANEISYLYRGINGTPDQHWPSDFVLHLKGLSTDGVVGLSPIDLAREAVGLSLAAEQLGGKFFSNGTHVGSYFTTDGKLTPEARKNIEKSIERDWGGVANSHKAPVLEQGLKIERMNMSAQDAQFLESRKFQTTEIARIFKVPPHMIGDLDRATFSNIEQQSIDFVRHSILPWCVRWEQRLNTTLLSEKEQDELYFEFNLNGFLRGEALAEAQVLQIETRNGVRTPNEWRDLKGMNPRTDPGGDKYMVDQSMSDPALDNIDNKDKTT